MTIVVNKYTDSGNLYNDVSSFMVEHINRSLEHKDFVSIVLCGGRTPLNIYRKLVYFFKSSSIDLSKIYFFFGDERFVSPSESGSNYKAAKEELFDQLNIPLDNVFPMVTDIFRTIEENKSAYICKIEDFFRERKKEIVFDIMLLGIGDDGHTASLFPEDENLVSSDIVRAVFHKKALPPVPRITLGINIINKSEKIIVISDSENKQKIVEKILRTNADPRYPASFIDKEKASFYYLVANTM